MIDIAGAEFPLLDTIVDWMTAFRPGTRGLRRIQLTGDYSLDLELKLEGWCNLFREVRL